MCYDEPMVVRYLARHALVGVFGAALVGTAAQSSGQSNASSEDIILGAWSDPEKCNRGNATRLAFDQVIAQGAALNGRCVAVEGYWAASALFTRQRDGNRDRSNVARALRKNRIGIYAREEVLEAAPTRATRYLMVGVVGQCETEWPDAMMVMGYCHYTGGPILKIAETSPVRTISAR